jgi:cysteine desulfurase / selenocysteine lyase
VEEIALGGNTGFGINVAALGLPVPPGATILASAGEFPTNVYPWMAQEARGARLELVPTDASGHPDAERILERLERGDVAVLALSAVQFGTGYRADLARFGAACRERGVPFVVDAIQALGCIPLDVEAMRIDVLATGGHKWLCGPFGTGFLYVRRALQEVLEPRMIGWTAMRASRDLTRLTEYEWTFVDDARRYEQGTVPFHDLAGFAASMELLMEVGVKRIEAHVAGLLDRLAAGLRGVPGAEIASDLRPAHRSGILAFRVPDAEAAYAALGEAGVICALREHAIRIAPHLYSTPGDIDRVLDVISEARKG